MQDGVGHREFSSEQGGDLGCHILSAAAVGVDRDPGQAFVDRGPLVEQLLHPRSDVAEEQRAPGAEADPLNRVGQADPEEHHGVALEQGPGRRIEDRSPTQSEHPVVRVECGRDDLALQRAEGNLAVVDEDLLHRLAGPRLDRVVAVEESDVEGVCQ